MEPHTYIINDVNPGWRDAYAFTPYFGRDLLDILSIQQDRIVRNDNTVSYKNLILQIPQSKHRYHYVKCKVICDKWSHGKVVSLLAR